MSVNPTFKLVLSPGITQLLSLLHLRYNRKNVINMRSDLL